MIWGIQKGRDVVPLLHKGILLFGIRMRERVGRRCAAASWYTLGILSPFYHEHLLLKVVRSSVSRLLLHLVLR